MSIIARKIIHIIARLLVFVSGFTLFGLPYLFVYQNFPEVDAASEGMICIYISLFIFPLILCFTILHYVPDPFDEEENDEPEEIIEKEPVKAKIPKIVKAIDTTPINDRYEILDL